MHRRTNRSGRTQGADVTQKRHDAYDRWQAMLHPGHAEGPVGSDGGRLPAPGVCVDCGVEIPVVRRAAKPDAERCIECQVEYEDRRRKWSAA